MTHNLARDSASRRIGTDWEVTVCKYGNGEGFPLDRRALAGRRDLGDLMGRPGWVIGCKNEQTIRLSQYMNDLKVQKDNTRRRMGQAVSEALGTEAWMTSELIGVELVKRRGYGTGRAYAVMEFDDLLQVWRELDR